MPDQQKEIKEFRDLPLGTMKQANQSSDRRLTNVENEVETLKRTTALIESIVRQINERLEALQ